MMNLMIKINCNNAAFQDGQPEIEAARILRETADKIETEGSGGEPVKLRDINGNAVGSFSWS